MIPPALRRWRELELHPRLPWLAGIAALLAFAAWYWNPVYRYDEYLVAVGRTRLGWPELLDVITTTDPAPGPLYLLMKLWTAVSSDPWWTRLPSLVAMAVAVAALAAFVRSAFDGRTAVYAATVAIAMPGLSRWAQDNRMYAPAAAFAALAVLCWWRSVHGGGRRWSVAYGLSVVAMGLFHLYTLTLVPALLLAALWIPGSRRDTLARTILPAMAAAVPLLPHVALNFLVPTGSPTNPPLSIRSLSQILLDQTGLPLGIALVGLAALGVVWAWRHSAWRAGVVVAVAWIVVPLGLFVLARAGLGMPTLSPRYSVFVLLALAALAALGVAAIGSRWRLGVVAVLVVVVGLGLPGQLAARRPGAHSRVVYVLSRLLQHPELASYPIAVMNPSSAISVNAATYPAERIATVDGPPSPVAVVVGRRGTPADGAVPYLDPGGAWRTVVTCRSAGKVIVEVVATFASGVSPADAEQLARTLSEEAPGSRCGTPGA